MVKIMHQTGQHQKAALLAAKPRAGRQHPSRQHYMREMAGMTIDVATGIAGRGSNQTPQGRCRYWPPEPIATAQARPATDEFQIARRQKPSCCRPHRVTPRAPHGPGQRSRLLSIAACVSSTFDIANASDPATADNQSHLAFR